MTDGEIVEAALASPEHSVILKVIIPAGGQRRYKTNGQSAEGATD
jgi:hypothetical protein